VIILTILGGETIVPLRIRVEGKTLLILPKERIAFVVR
jgi:hypothetical protein